MQFFRFNIIHQAKAWFFFVCICLSGYETNQNKTVKKITTTTVPIHFLAKLNRCWALCFNLYPSFKRVLVVFCSLCSDNGTNCFFFVCVFLMLTPLSLSLSLSLSLCPTHPHTHTHTHTKFWKPANHKQQKLSVYYIVLHTFNFEKCNKNSKMCVGIKSVHRYYCWTDPFWIIIDRIMNACILFKVKILTIFDYFCFKFSLITWTFCLCLLLFFFLCLILGWLQKLWKGTKTTENKGRRCKAGKHAHKGCLAK